MKHELLAPAGNADIAIDAIKHGADAVYIGPPSHGARKSAANSLEDIKRAVDFAHIYNAKVYVTVNTIVYDREIKEVEKMIRQLHTIGVDALIVQDMGILRMDIPPIALHASTQCDIRTPEKARFLQEVGFSQIVLARELSIAEIKAICDSVTIPVETFIHGALCVSYSGRCSAGYACAGRSGNKGECPQICRQAFTLRDADGRLLAKDKYLLSLKDFRADIHIKELIEAGVSSFKIEGRLKEAGYVKNVTAYYSRLLDSLGCERTSAGKTEFRFTPNVEKSFNRGFTDYRLSGAPDKKGIASIHTPKSLGETIKDPGLLKNGDGISYFDRNGQYTGMLVNKAYLRLPKGVEIHRTSDVEWKKLMAGDTAKRTIAMNVETGMTPGGELVLKASDETGAEVTTVNSIESQKAEKIGDYRKVFEKLGGTPFRLGKFTDGTSGLFFPLSALTALRRDLVERLLSAKRTVYSYDRRRPENTAYPYPADKTDYRDNVANKLAERFYRDHGVKKIEPALETGAKPTGEITVMTSRHCILRELGLCLKTNPGIKLPLTLQSGKLQFTPRFDCSECEMELVVSSE